MKKVNGIAFDLEGTVVDLEKCHLHYGFVPAAKEFGLDIEFDDILTIPNAIGGGDKLIAEGLSKMSGGRIDPVELLKAKMLYYNEAIAKQEIIPRRGFCDVLDIITYQLRLPVAIGSLTPSEQASVIFERSGVNKLFPRENIVLLEDVKNRKPAPDVFLETARRMGISPEEQVVFEDSGTGVQAALAAGSVPIVMPVFQTAEILEKLVRVGARRIFLSWREMNVISVLHNISVNGE